MSLRGARDGAVPRVFILDDLSEAQAAAARRTALYVRFDG
jgi:hypothetical protein